MIISDIPKLLNLKYLRNSSMKLIKICSFKGFLIKNNWESGSISFSTGHQKHKDDRNNRLLIANDFSRYYYPSTINTIKFKHGKIYLLIALLRISKIFYFNSKH